MVPEDPFGTTQSDPPGLTITIDRGDDSQAGRIAVAGEMDGFNGVRVYEAVVDLVHRQRPARLAIDLAEVTFLDSGGIRCLLLCHADAEHADCRLMVVDAHPNAYRALRITGLLDFLGLVQRNP
jgi:anti-anti-sigma factor